MSTKYKILLDKDTEIFEDIEILFRIPIIKTMIEEIKKNDNITDKYVINLSAVNSITFSHILTLIKYNSSNIENECDIFNTNFIKNMNINTLMDFILVSHNLGLEKYKQIAANKFMNIFNKNDFEYIRNEFNLNNDLLDDDIHNINNIWQEEIEKIEI